MTSYASTIREKSHDASLFCLTDDTLARYSIKQLKYGSESVLLRTLYSDQHIQL